MSIAGIGADLVAVERVRGALARHGQRFADRILTAAEQEGFRRAADPAALLARRFAVKEAAAKALGTGIAAGVSFQDFELRHDSVGAPRLHLSGRAAALAVDAGVGRVHVSISDERDRALAFVVLESASPGGDPP